MEHFVIILDSFFQKLPGRLVKGRGIFGIFLIQNTICLPFICAIAEDGRNPQLFGRIFRHLFLKLSVIQLGHRHARHREDGIKTTDALFPLDFFHFVTLGRCHFLNIHQCIIYVGFITTVRLLIEMLQDIAGHKLDALGRHHGLLPVNIPDHLIRDFFLSLHRLDIIYPEWEYILVIDCIHNGIAVKLIAKRLRRSKEFRVFRPARIHGKDWCTGEAEQMVFLKVFHNRRMHVPKLAPMALVKNDDYVFRIHLMNRVLLDKGCQFLDGCDNDMGFHVFQLLFQNRSGGVAVCRPFFKTIIFLHGLVVQILTVYHEQYFVNIREP